MTDHAIATPFFDTYARALLARDAEAIADHYAVPALIEFPDRRIAVSDASQTAEFFRGAFAQYEGVSSAHALVTVVAEAAHSVWADVLWTYNGDAPEERNLYQLVRTDGEWKIAVLTPL